LPLQKDALHENYIGRAHRGGKSFGYPITLYLSLRNR